MIPSQDVQWQISNQVDRQHLSNTQVHKNLQNVPLEKILRQSRSAQPSLDAQALLKEMNSQLKAKAKKGSHEAQSGNEKIVQFLKKMTTNGEKSQFIVRQETYKHGMLVAVKQKPLQYKKLSGKARRVLEDVDGWALGIEGEPSLEEAQSAGFAGKPPSLMQKTYSIYISYTRATSYKEAEVLYKYLQGMESLLGIKVHFTPLQSTATREDMQNMIAAADLFFIIADGRYGQKGSLSGCELAKALELAKYKTRYFISSIVIQKPDLEIFAQFEKYPTLFIYNKDVRNLLKRIGYFIYAQLVHLQNETKES